MGAGNAGDARNTPKDKGRKAQGNAAGLNRAILACAIVSVLGLVLYGVELANGMALTGMRNLDSWGLYIMGFMFFVGLGSGCLAVAAFPRLVGRPLPIDAERTFCWAGLCAMLLAGILIVVDLGQPMRMYELFASANMSSPLMWDVLAVGLFIVVAVVYLAFLRRFEDGRSTAAAMRVMSGVACGAALVVITVDAWIFGLQHGREMWSTALLGPWFATSALLSGVAFAIVAQAVAGKAGRGILPDGVAATLYKVLGALACIDAYCFLCDLVTSGYGDGAVAGMLLAGPLAPLFWLQMACLALCAVVCFVPKLRCRPLAIAAPIAALAAAFLKRAELVVGGFQLPQLEWAGPMSGYTITDASGTLAQAYAGMVYAPTPLEVGVFLGMVGVGSLVFCLGMKYLPGMRGAASEKE